jgi:hypothetical protein
MMRPCSRPHFRPRRDVFAHSHGDLLDDDAHGLAISQARRGDFEIKVAAVEEIGSQSKDKMTIWLRSQSNLWLLQDVF